MKTVSYVTMATRKPSFLAIFRIFHHFLAISQLINGVGGVVIHQNLCLDKVYRYRKEKVEKHMFCNRGNKKTPIFYHVRGCIARFMHIQAILVVDS